MNSLPLNFPAANLPQTDLYKIQWFYRKYVEEYYTAYGFGHYLLAVYATVPLLLTPDLVYKIWQNFNGYKWAGEAASIHRVAVPDLLLSPLCREIGFELYEMHPEIRMALLQWLYSEAGTPIWIKREMRTVTQIAAFVEYYYAIPSAAGQRWGAGYVETQLLEAKSFSKPGEVAGELLKKLQQAAVGAQEAEMLRVMDMFVKTKKRLEMLGDQGTAAFNVYKGQAAFMEAWKSLIQKNNASFIEKLNANPDLLQLLTQTNNGGIEIKISAGVVERLTVVAHRRVLALIIGFGKGEIPDNRHRSHPEKAGSIFENSAHLIHRAFKEFIPAKELNIKILTGQNATKTGILRTWEELCSSATENDNLIFYIAAYAEVQNSNCLIKCVDSENFNKNGNSLLADEEIRIIASSSKSSSITAIIQADHAGTPNWLDTTKRNRIIFASSKFETSDILTEKTQYYFAFTYALVQSLRGNHMKLPVRELFAETLRHYEIFIREEDTNKTASTWKEQVPYLISSRESYNYLFGSSNNLTAQLQDLLRQCAYSDAITTGEWNGETAKALSLFCKDTGLSKNLSKQEYIDHLISNNEQKSAAYMPAFVLIFSDPEERLKTQQEERAKILEIMRPIAASIQIILLDNPDKKVFINMLKEKGNRNRIELIYYSGNDDQGNFILNDGSFTITDFAPLLAYQENIQLMVSNTCNSAFFAETVTQLGVSAAIGIKQLIMDDVASAFGQSLFQWIMVGKPVETFFDDLNRNRNSPLSNGNFLFYKAGWFPKDSVISWERFVAPKSDDKSPEIYSLVIGIDYPEETRDNLAEKNVLLMNTWLQGLPKSKDNKVLVNSRNQTVSQKDIDNSFNELINAIGKSANSEKLLFVYLAGKGKSHPEYPVFCVLDTFVNVELRPISIQAYFWTLSNSAVFNNVLFCYDLEEDEATNNNGMEPQFGSHKRSGIANGALIGHFTESIPNNQNISQSVVHKDKETGQFTRKLLESLQGKAADSDGYVTANLISSFLKNEIPEIASNRIGEKDFIIAKPGNNLHQKVIIKFTSNCIGKKLRLLDQSLQLIDEIKVSYKTLGYELEPGIYIAEILETSLQKSFSVQFAPDTIVVDIGWKFLNKYICVIGSRYTISKEKEATAQALGKFLADEGYGLITGGWQGIDMLVTKAYYETVKKYGVEKDALRQIIAENQPVNFEKGVIETVSSNSWNEAVIERSFAIISIGGKKFTYNLFERARTANLPFIPLPHTKGDSLKIYNELLKDDNSPLPKQKLKELGNHESIEETGFFDTIKAILDTAVVDPIKTR